MSVKVCATCKFAVATEVVVLHVISHVVLKLGDFLEQLLDEVLLLLFLRRLIEPREVFLIR